MKIISHLFDSYEFNSSCKSNSNFINEGRNFLRGLMLYESNFANNASPLKSDNLLIQVKNWQRTVALILRKLSSVTEDTTDNDFEIKMAIFKLNTDAANGIRREE